MSNVIIIIILAAAIALGVRESVKHFKGEGGCCGGGSSYKPKKKKLEGTITHTYVLQVEDMHCQNCANTITGAVNDIEGASAKVNLKKRTVTISCDRDVDIQVIKDAITGKGYKVKENS